MNFNENSNKDHLKHSSLKNEEPATTQKESNTAYINRFQKVIEPILKTVSEPVPARYTDMVHQIREYIIQRYEDSSKNKFEASFRIERSPLGKLDIRFLNEGNADKVTIIVESELAKNEVQKYVPAIQQGFQDKGIDLLKILVDVQDTEEKAKNNNQEESSNNRDNHKTGEEKYEEKVAHPKTKKDYGYNTMEVIA
jgi:flagellar hook-length control protein FliK